MKTFAPSRALRTPTLVIGFVLVGLVAAMAFAAPWVVRHGPLVQDLTAILEGPSAEHWLGTDQVGRDVFSRIVHAAQVDLRIGVLAVLLMFLLGSTLGTFAGYFGGLTDTVIMRFADVVSAIPVIIVIIVLVIVMGPGELSIYVAFTLIGWVAYARLMRAEVLVAKAADYVVSAKAAGLGTRRVIGRHILPNALQQSLTFAMTDVVNVILAIVVLGFLGLGISPPTAEWGAMIADGQAILQTKPHLSTFPGIAVFITALGFALLGDGISDLLRPSDG